MGRKWVRSGDEIPAGLAGFAVGCAVFAVITDVFAVRASVPFHSVAITPSARFRHQIPRQFRERRVPRNRGI
jgi:hypothetical protein